DPLADGKVNQDAASRALAAGATFSRVLDCVSTIRRKSDIPLFFYSYLNPLYARGFDRAMKEVKTAGIDGMLLLDLPFEESAPYASSLRKYGLDNVSLVTPTSPPARIKSIVGHASGFVYCVSRTGVTGLQKRLDADAGRLIKSTRKHTKLPIALGFGISTPAHARAAAEEADAIIVGSAIVKRFHEEAHTPRGRAAAAEWVSTLVKAVKEI
ncbi:MAG: tryptophan synthase subunit alpha, partial [Verrucomicrobia bacterium]|nr:tryptophan synthase subunit alpha [Verrucomicrobiota bacterium]